MTTQRVYTQTIKNCFVYSVMLASTIDYVRSNGVFVGIETTISKYLPVKSTREQYLVDSILYTVYTEIDTLPQGTEINGRVYLL